MNKQQGEDTPKIASNPRFLRYDPNPPLKRFLYIAAKYRSSTKSTRRSPDSHLETKDWGRAKRRATCVWVRPISSLACRSRFRKRRYFWRIPCSFSLLRVVGLV